MMAQLVRNVRLDSPFAFVPAGRRLIVNAGSASSAGHHTRWQDASEANAESKAETAPP